MSLLELLLAASAGAAAAVLAVASFTLLFRARLMRAVAANVRATVEQTAGALIKTGVEAIAKSSAEAADTLAALKSERGRVLALLRHHPKGGSAEEEAEADEAEADDVGGDRLDRLLANPLLQGFLQSKGINPQLVAGLADGNVPPEAIAQLQQLASKPAAPQEAPYL